MKLLITCTILFYGIFFLNSKIGHSSPSKSTDRTIEEKKKSIAIVGDLQRTSIWELVMGREQNDYERGQIIRSIADEYPAMVVLLGDMVFDGSSALQWDFFDSLVAPLKESGIPLLPVVGNHEYWGKRSNNLNFLYKRFSSLKQKTWYAQTHDSLALIFLNSNVMDMSSGEWEEQVEWYNNRIYYFENDPSIKGILVFTHHPPFTNSTITGDERHVQEAFLPVFIRSEKTIAFISGHAHTYERFKIDGKAFIISGGGGGPRVSLKIGRDCHKDLCLDESRVRPFNYLILDRVNDGVNIKVKALKKGTSDFYTLEEMTLPWTIKVFQANSEFPNLKD